MILHELHVAQRHAVAIGERHAVAGDDAAVRVLTEHPAGAAGRQNDRASGDGGEFPRRGRQHRRALCAAVFNQQVDAEIFVESLDRGIFGRGLEQRVQDMKAAAVGGEPGALHLHAAEGAHVDIAVGPAIPRAAPMLQLDHLRRAAADEIIDHVLLAEPVAAGDRVVEMVVERVMPLDDAGRPALRRHRMAAHRQHFGDQGDGERGICLGRRYGGAQARPARSNDQNIGIEMVQRATPFRSTYRRVGRRTLRESKAARRAWQAPRFGPNRAVA